MAFQLLSSHVPLATTSFCKSLLAVIASTFIVAMFARPTNGVVYARPRDRLGLVSGVGKRQSFSLQFVRLETENLPSNAVENN